MRARPSDVNRETRKRRRVSESNDTYAKDPHLKSSADDSFKALGKRVHNVVDTKLERVCRLRCSPFSHARNIVADTNFVSSSSVQHNVTAFSQSGNIYSGCVRKVGL